MSQLSTILLQMLCGLHQQPARVRIALFGDLPAIAVPSRLIDTTPLMAVCDTRDSEHRIALKHLELLASDEFSVCDAVLTEACFHLPHRSQRQRLRALLRNLGAQPIPLMYEQDFVLEVLDWLTRYADHEPDWADACLAVLSGRDKDLKVWTYDREFRTTWRRPNGTVVSLAVKSM